jgi:hypothetical protein
MIKKLKKGEIPSLTGVYSKCKICEEIKDDAYFKYSKGKRSGLICRSCSNETKLIKNASEDERKHRNTKAIIHYRANKEAIAINNKIRREENKEALRESKKLAHIKNAEKNNARSSAWYYANKEKVSIKSRQEYLNNPELKKERAREHYAENKEIHSERMKIWRSENPHMNTAYVRQYNLAKENRTPAWADVKTIHNFYRNCPEGLQVDHIHLLQGKLVSGLHILDNLQYLTKEQNTTKSNKFYPYWVYYEQNRIRIETSGPEASIYSIKHRR